MGGIPMIRTITLTAASALLVATVICAQGPSANNYAITPEVGPWMILVASYRGDDSRLKAEELCQELHAMKIHAYAFNHAEQERTKETQRVAAIREQQKQQLRAAGLPEDTPMRIKTIRIEAQSAV